MLIDSHVNLHGKKFADDLDDVLTRSWEADISALLNICCNLKDLDAVLKVADKGKNIWASVGTHPHDAKDNPDIEAETIIKLSNHPKIIGIGETGLDYHYDWSPRDIQKANFQAHIEAVQDTGLPLICLLYTSPSPRDRG